MDVDRSSSPPLTEPRGAESATAGCDDMSVPSSVPGAAPPVDLRTLLGTTDTPQAGGQAAAQDTGQVLLAALLQELQQKTSQASSAQAVSVPGHVQSMTSPPRVTSQPLSTLQHVASPSIAAPTSADVTLKLTQLLTSLQGTATRPHPMQAVGGTVSASLSTPAAPATSLLTSQWLSGASDVSHSSVVTSLPVLHPPVTQQATQWSPLPATSASTDSSQLLSQLVSALAPSGGAASRPEEQGLSAQIRHHSTILCKLLEQQKTAAVQSYTVSNSIAGQVPSSTVFAAQNTCSSNTPSVSVPQTEPSVSTLRAANSDALSQWLGSSSASPAEKLRTLLQLLQPQTVHHASQQSQTQPTSVCGLPQPASSSFPVSSAPHSAGWRPVVITALSSAGGTAQLNFGSKELMIAPSTPVEVSAPKHTAASTLAVVSSPTLNLAVGQPLQASTTEPNPALWLKEEASCLLRDSATQPLLTEPPKTPSSDLKISDLGFGTIEPFTPVHPVHPAQKMELAATEANISSFTPTNRSVDTSTTLSVDGGAEHASFPSLISSLAASDMAPSQSPFTGSTFSGLPSTASSFCTSHNATAVLSATSSPAISGFASFADLPSADMPTDSTPPSLPAVAALQGNMSYEQNFLPGMRPRQDSSTMLSSPSVTSPRSPQLTYDEEEATGPEGSTQHSLISRSSQLLIADPDDSAMHGESDLLSDGADLIQRPAPRKVRKKHRTDTPYSNRHVNVKSLYAADPAQPGSFRFQKFGMTTTDSQGETTQSERHSEGESEPSRPPLQAPALDAAACVPVIDIPLTSQFPATFGDLELAVLVQPEQNHRARYLTEGSRGAIKDVSQKDFPVVKLFGYTEKVKLLLYVGSDLGKARPHAFYQACRVSGRNCTPCAEFERAKTSVICLDLLPENDMSVSVDCVGILKLRNADVEARAGYSKTKKRSNRARLVFRTCVPQPGGLGFVTLQVCSHPISCTQPVGQPEVFKKSGDMCSVQGGKELFLIGRNFLKGAQVIFTQHIPETDSIIWEKEAVVDPDCFQPTHLVCTVPEFTDKTIREPCEVNVRVKCGAKCSEPFLFRYTPSRSRVASRGLGSRGR